MLIRRQGHSDHLLAVVLLRAQESVEIVHEEDRPDDRRGQTQLLNMLLDPPFALEVRDAGVALGAADRGVDEVLHIG